MGSSECATFSPCDMSGPACDSSQEMAQGWGEARAFPNSCSASARTLGQLDGLASNGARARKVRLAVLVEPPVHRRRLPVSGHGEEPIFSLNSRQCRASYFFTAAGLVLVMKRPTLPLSRWSGQHAPEARLSRVSTGPAATLDPARGVGVRR